MEPLLAGPEFEKARKIFSKLPKRMKFNVRQKRIRDLLERRGRIDTL